MTTDSANGRADPTRQTVLRYRRPCRRRLFRLVLRQGSPAPAARNRICRLVRSGRQQDETDRRRRGQHENYTIGLGYRLVRSRDHRDAAGLEGKRLCRGSVVDRDGMADRLESFSEGSTKQTDSQHGDGHGVARFRSRCERACLAWAWRLARRSMPAVAATAITPRNLGVG